MTRFLKFAAAIMVLLALLAILAAYVLGEGSVHPYRRVLTARAAAEAKQELSEINAATTDIEVGAPDGSELKGWIATHASTPGDPPPTNWVLLFHGQGDNRLGTLGLAEFLIPAGYGVVMMDSRAQGESGGSNVTYGALESADEGAVADKLKSQFPVHNLFALGVSMGAAIALDSAASDPRIEAVVAEAPFASLHEASYDYVSLHHGPWLGRTILWPATIAGLYAMQQAGNFNAADAAPNRAVAKRPFPVLIIADAEDRTLPPRHAERVFHSAIGPKQFWLVPNASHASASGAEPAEFRHRVLTFFSTYAKGG
jgi:uncharacterized protein